MRKSGEVFRLNSRNPEFKTSLEGVSAGFRYEFHRSQKLLAAVIVDPLQVERRKIKLLPDIGSATVDSKYNIRSSVGLSAEYELRSYLGVGSEVFPDFRTNI